MSKIWITGSSDGLGQLAAKALIAQGHEVVLHARNEKRAQEALKKIPDAAGIVIGDLNDRDETIALASQVNVLGKFDAIIHNAGVYGVSASEIFNINTLAPYILTCLVDQPERLIYLSSGMQSGGRSKLEFFQSDPHKINYSDSKLHVLMLCKAIARKWPQVYANALDPGWVPTKMGGANAPDNLQKGYETQVWLATSHDEQAKVSGKFFHHQRQTTSNLEADDVGKQDRFLSLCEEITGIALLG